MLSGCSKVAVIVQDGAEPFGLGSLVEVWGEPYHPEDDNPVFDFQVCTPRPGRVQGRSDYDLVVERGLDATADADLVCLAPKYDFLDHDPAVLEAVRAAARARRDRLRPLLGRLRARRGRPARRPRVHHALALHRPAGARRTRRRRSARTSSTATTATILTGAGSAAGIDASLHLMRDQFGAKVAATTARRIVVPPHRDGGQAQFIANAVPDCDAETLGPLLQWIVANLGEDLGVETLARRSHMSPRTFARRFRAETGTTPHAGSPASGCRPAEELLERTDHSVDWIADEVGFGNAATLRHHFAPGARAQPAAVPPPVRRLVTSDSSRAAPRAGCPHPARTGRP